MTIPIEKGIGILSLPSGLQEVINSTYIIVHAIKNNTQTHGETLMLFCDNSFYLDREKNFHRNVLQMFDSALNIVYFSTKIINSMTVINDKCQLEVQKWENGEFKSADDYCGLVLLEIFGYRKDV